MPPGKIQTIGGSQIVQTYCGTGTGDTLHRTADGKVWKEVPRYLTQTTLPTGYERQPIITHD